MSNNNAHVQPRVDVVSEKALFAGDIQPIDVEGASNFSDLYGELTEVHSPQNKAAAMLLLRLVDKVKVLLPANKIWVPEHVESTRQPAEFDVDAPGITFISPQSNVLSVIKDGITRNNAIKDGNIGFVFNPVAGDKAHVAQLDNSNQFDQRIFIISGSVTRR